ncbi:LapA family protein [Nonomuraea diastatica]|uniref:LapA family protein n=1 Tax=Nonomuraea diastatica TaxID=1848329 RepID=A0A4V6PD17_9ACTN|nr:LapA family protein [Nonomuraea diastatica]
MVTEQRPVSRLGTVPPRVWLALVLLVLAVVFILQNRQDAVIQLFMIVVTAPLWITLVACTAIGILIGALIGRRGAKGR